MNVYGHLFEGKQRELTSDLDELLGRVRSESGPNGAGTDGPRYADDIAD